MYTLTFRFPSYKYSKNKGLRRISCGHDGFGRVTTVEACSPAFADAVDGPGEVSEEVARQASHANGYRKGRPGHVAQVTVLDSSTFPTPKQTAFNLPWHWLAFDLPRVSSNRESKTIRERTFTQSTEKLAPRRVGSANWP